MKEMIKIKGRIKILLKKISRYFFKVQNLLQRLQILGVENRGKCTLELLFERSNQWRSY